ncbi:mannosyltransferase [Mycolicibacterium smegmatis]|uniref:Polyprenol-phosphate-mannose-dependent alpha-(1-2)-phosphatidylinositol pentamannoside mannosyltransferase n=3 Tax=Mycolicibacterium smegmatis TaxID=1772 RepID=PIME_MYCS2|nr:RecName: Full=Polyprenol-phosphate-mannose-dependent alpha-(1-2)-phosphatidylinositol pentamannoside mannosyltransferase; AltName: Full=Alpha-mannosyltransferase; Short=Alpha-ManT; AltName: Full=PPM-dependent mannosyltransferase; AltName: Full=Polyprenol-phosphate-mannose alpha-mannosyltransferase; Short=PPM alpha-mannosyltransferase [Mycolicibacterium smegmatis MC2 155]MBE9621483.1 mannosyltransferase [Mycolicibacterium smegmatis]MBE9627898.1 mannosyltransferase [Mycolicibacterium smegmatis]
MRVNGYRGAKVGAVDTTSPPEVPASARLQRLAPMLLVVSILARLAWTYLVPNGANFVDLHVYVGGADALDGPGALYDYVYADQTPDFPLPFTYPPFAAIVFYPLHLLPFGVVAFIWQIGIIAALYGVVRVSQRLMGLQSQRRVAMLWTALGIWTEPLRSTFDYGQVNVVLVLAVLCAVSTTRWWLSGLLVGLAAGIKLTPAVAGLYFLGARRWAAVACSAAVFFATVGVSWLVVGAQARRYFTELLGDADRIGPIGTSFNQSWRGGISRILGHDAGFGPLVLIGIGITAVLALLAWRAIGGAQDRLGGILVVSLFGLVLSPISWTHHWVWLIPLMMWLLHGPLSALRGARILGWGWLALTLLGVPWLLSFAQPTIWEIGRPWYLAWAGLVYIVATLATLGWIAFSRKGSG